MTTLELFAHQVRLEQRNFWRNRGFAFFTFALPLGLLVIFGGLAQGHTVPDRPDIPSAVAVVPGFMTFGLIAAAYGNLAATITVARYDGVLKRIRATPLQPAVYLAGVIGSVLVVCAAITVAGVVVGWALFGVAPSSERVALFLAAIVLGVVCFASLAVAVSALVPTADSVSAITNATYVPLAILSGTFSDQMKLPSWLNHVIDVLPVKPFTEAVKAAYDPAGHHVTVAAIVVLLAWSVVGVLVAVRRFRWEP